MTKENITSKDVEQIIKQPVVRPSVLNSREPIKNKYPDVDAKTKEDLDVYQELVDTLTDDSFLDATTTRTRKNIKECLVNTLKRKYKMSNGELAKTVEGLLELHGMADKNFDPLARKADFLASKLNDISIDDNANKSEKTMKALYTELSLAFSKLDGYDSIYKVLVELYGKQKAKQLTGDLYDYSLAMNDSTNITIPYCYCMDASKLVTVGKSFGKVHSSPAKSISTYVSVLTDLVREFSFNIAGACAIGTFFLDMANLLIYVERVTLKELKENKEVQKYVKNCFQKVIYSVNHYSRNASESPFTNISCFDYTKLKTLINKDNYKWYYPQKLKVLLDNGLVEEASNSSDQKYTCSEEAWDNFVIDYIMTLQEMFLDIFDKGDPLRDGTQFPFPVTTLNLSVAVDDKGKRALVEENVFGKGNRLEKFIVHKDPIKYNIYASEGTKMASCCFSGKQKVVIQDKTGKIEQLSFEDAYKKLKDDFGYKVSHQDGWVEGTILRLAGRDLYKITTKNRKEIVVTDNHINVTEKGDIKTSDLNTSYSLCSYTKEGLTYDKIDKIERVPAEEYVYCFEIAENYQPYFTLANGIITHNCRLLSDTEAFGDFAGSVNSFGGSSVSLGSARVVTLNFARAALEATSYDHFKKIILERVDSIAKILKAHRILILKLKDKGYQPFLANGMINFNRMFGTFGALGYLEADRMLKEKFGNEDFDYLKDFMVFFNKACTEKFQEKDENGKKIYNFPFNIEQIPGESMAPKLAKADKLVFPKADLPELYANQFTSLWEDKTIDEKLRRDGELGLLLTGGGIVHIQVNSNVTAPQAHNLIKKAVSYGCAHFAINGTWSYCEHDSKKFEGNLEDCPICGKKLDHYTRVIGYFSKVEDWNKTRRQKDFPNRKFTSLKPLSIENAPKKPRKKRK